jgi:hypothetical protein
MSAGAVSTPADVIVPSGAVPPGTPFTLQLTAVSFVFVTVAVKVAWAPSTTDPFAGFTVTASREVAARRLLHRSRSSTFPSQEARQSQSSLSWIFFHFSARGTACHRQSRRRASEKKKIGNDD